MGECLGKDAEWPLGATEIEERWARMLSTPTDKRALSRFRSIRRDVDADAQDDIERGEGGECNPDVRIGNPVEHDFE